MTDGVLDTAGWEAEKANNAPVGVIEPYMAGKTPNEAQMLFAGEMKRECRERYYLGTPGCGKSTALIAEVNRYCLTFPGSTWLLARYTETEAASILKGDFEKETPAQVLTRWDHEERRWYYRNGSSVYIHGLKPAEGQAPFSKFAGYNLSGVGVSQVEALPDVTWTERLYERLRNPVGPRLLLAEGNIDVERGHWLFGLVSSAREIEPRRLYRSGPRMILIGNLEDNAGNLTADYVAGMKAKYPVGHPGYWPKVGGWFGVIARGEPVYGPLFVPDKHLDACEAVPQLPLLESWDFGISRPAVSWSQFLPGGRFRVLGEWMGDGTPLGDAIVETKRLRGLWFPKCKTVWRTADPTGENRKDTGKSSVQFLRDAGLSVQVRRGANTPQSRTWAIQQVRDLMARTTKQGEAFGAHPRCQTYVEGLQSGYVRDPNRVDGMPVKDGYFDHLQNTVEYTLLAFFGAGEMDIGTAEGPVTVWLGELRDPGEPKRDRRSVVSGY